MGPGGESSVADLTGESRRGFTLLEMLIVIIILGIIVAFAVPEAYNGVKAYRVHSDATSMVEELNLARFRATSQNVPYEVHIDTANNEFYLERLCTTTPFTSCTALLEGGDQYVSTEDSFTLTNPGTSCPPPAPDSFSACAGTTDFYFNSRGMPVDVNGSPIANGGEVIYVAGPATLGLTDAVTVTVGGQINSYDWDVVATNWILR